MNGAGEQIAGTWERRVAPLADDLLLPGKMGVEVRLSARDAVAGGDMILELARLLDRYEARRGSGAPLALVIFISLALLVVML